MTVDLRIAMDRAVREAARHNIRHHVLYAQTLLDISCGIMVAVYAERDTIPYDALRWLFCSQIYVAICALQVDADTRDLV